ncbi:MAG: hypothetical protein ABH826_01105 [Patescibacteria group bacterium]
MEKKNIDVVIILLITLIGTGVVLIAMGAIIIYDFTMLRNTSQNHLSTPIVLDEKADFNGIGVENFQESEFRGATFVYDADQYIFEVNSDYVGEDGLLWTKERYENFSKFDSDEPAGQRGSVPAYLTMRRVDSDLDGVERYAIIDNALDANALSLAELDISVEFWSHEYVTLGDKKFLKLVSSDLFEMTSYYLEHDGYIYVFKTPYPENQTYVEEILSTIIFK